MSISVLFRVQSVVILFFFLGNLKAQEPNRTFFEKLSPRKTGIDFKNQLKEDAENNILRYEYFYNGGGVAAGDLDGDGLDEIFFTGNMVGNKLFKNLGGMRFSDVTKSAGVAGKSTWSTGVSMADVNGDGLLDIYVCYSGKKDPASRKNELWINLGNLRFEDQAEAYGLADQSNSTQGLFFDYDRDGDLDLYLLNHNTEVISEIQFDEVRAGRHPFAGDKLYRNDNGKFIDVSESAGIKGTGLGFGLAVISSDVNGDGWPDLLVTNDYIEPDYLYINNGNGTFTDRLKEQLQHISHFSMGADIADLNHDGKPEIFTLDMLPEDNERQKLLYGPENYEQYNLMLNRNFYHQLMRNMLHVNHGNGLFSEVGQLAGISNTDWSWSALFFDANNDSEKDLLVTNGYFRDYTNRDFLKYKGDYYFKQAVAKEKADTLHLVTSMTSTPIHDYFFENQGNISFKDISLTSGFSAKNFSSGAAYSDLDNDGDLDVIINHLNEPAGIFENKSHSGNWIKIKLKSTTANTQAIGAKVEIQTKGKTHFSEMQPVRGFQSSSSLVLHVGLGEENQIQGIQVIWPDGSIQFLQNPEINQTLEIIQSGDLRADQTPQPIFPLLERINTIPDFNPSLSKINDFKRQPLLINMPSHLGPVLASADLNQDGKPDVYIGGSKGQAGRIYTFSGEKWEPYRGFRSAAEFTDAVVIFEDFNQDGHPDLLLGSGGYHDYLTSDEALRDRLYLNDGQGVLIPQSDFPDYHISTGAIVPIDLDTDGDLDLFIGGRIIPGRFPELPESKILINQGSGKFTDETSTWLTNSKIGMISSGVVQDLNQDGKSDLILTGEYLSPVVLINSGNQLTLDSSYFEQNLNGWWNTIHQEDMDGDGDLDLIMGNYGWNSPFKADSTKEIRLFAADFDQNGSVDPILECFIGDGYYPFASRDELLDQLVSMRSKFTDYASYSKAKMSDLLTKEELEKAQKLSAQTLASTYFENTGNGFKAHILPREAQSMPVNAIKTLDINKDGNLDLILGGNQSQTRIRIGKIDAGLGLILIGDGKGNFKPLSPDESGLAIKGDIKSILPIFSDNNQYLIFGINQQAIQLFQIK